MARTAKRRTICERKEAERRTRRSAATEGAGHAQGIRTRRRAGSRRPDRVRHRRDRHGRQRPLDRQQQPKQELIVGSPEMTPAGITAEAKKAGLDVAGLSIPTRSVANKKITNGDLARAFAGYMRIHALEATHGLTYAQMGRFIAKPGAPAKFTDGQGATSDPTYALVDPKTKQPVENGARNLWVTETALTTALNTSYMAQQLSLFGIVVGVALLLAGIGFGILALGGALANPRTALSFLRKRAHSPELAAKA